VSTSQYLPQKRDFNHVNRGPDTSGPGAIDVGPKPDLSSLLRGNFDRNVSLAQRGSRSIDNLQRYVLRDGTSYLVGTFGYDANGRQIYWVEGFLQHVQEHIRDEAAYVLRAIAQSVRYIFRRPDAGPEIGPDYDAALRMQLNECITGNDDDVMLLNETYFQSQLVRVGVRSL
jgi:hypothetical protein